MMNHKVAQLILGAMLLAQPLLALQRKAQFPCRTEYENHNQIDYGPLTVQEVKGTIIDPQQLPMPQACIAIFTEGAHKLVATTESDADGKFSLRGISPGRYRLVAKAGPLCAANVPLRVLKHQKKKHVLLIHMKPRGLDTCSYGELIQPPK